jgi:hypothetical protein
MSDFMTTGDSRKLWRREVANAPAHMLAREFTQNAIDSVERRHPCQVTWGLINKGKTLYCMDTGSGMTAEELTKVVTEMSYSGENRSDDLHGNFGIGARMIGLKASPTGVDYYTRMDGGPIYKAGIGLDADGYPICTHKPKEVKRAPVTMPDSGTLAVFKQPMKGSAFSGTTIQSELVERYFRYPKNVRVRLTCEMPGGGDETANYKHMVTMRELMATKVKKSGHYSVKKAANGVTIHYGYTEDPLLIRHYNTRVSPRAMVVWQGEVYHAATKSEMLQEATMTGLGQVAKNLYIAVELPDDFPVTPSSHRDQLIWSDEVDRPGVSKRARHARLRNFSAEITETMPVWLKKMVERAFDDDLDNAKKRGRDRLLDMLRAARAFVSGVDTNAEGEDEAGEDDVEVGPGDGEGAGDGPGSGGKGTQSKSPGVGGLLGQIRLALNNPPDVSIINDDEVRFPVMFGREGDKITVVINDADPYIDMIKHEAMAAMPDMTDKQLVIYWQALATEASYTTFLLHWAATVSLRKTGKFTEDELVDMLEPVAVAGAYGHVYNFHTEIRKLVKQRAKAMQIAAMAAEEAA